MFCLFSPSTCANLLRVCNGDTVPNHENKMHSSEAVPPATGPGLLLQLGRLIIRSRSGSPAPAPASAPAPAPEHKHKPSTCHQVTSQPQKCDDERALEEQLSRHVNALWAEQMPVCIEVLLSPECGDCLKALSRPDEGAFDKRPRGLLLERWTMNTLVNKAPHSPSFMSSQWLLNAVRSQLHFSQLSAWLARLAPPPDHAQRRRKLSREQCNYKKVEANCDSTDEQTDETRKLNIVYSIKIPADNKLKEFTKPPTDHTFPFTDIGNNIFLKVVLESLPRLDDIPIVKCACPKRKPSVDVNINVPDDLIGRFNDLSVSCSYDGAIDNSKNRLNVISDEKSYIIQSVLDDRMLTPCSESGKHKCSCDDESDSKDKNTPKKLDERRIKEIAKYKRRLRKEKMRKICDSTSSEGDGLKIKETTSIPILQAARFDRLRAIGCYRNQTYLTLPTTRIETKSPFTDTELPPVEFKKTNTVGTQTDFTCQCGNLLEVTCEDCNQGMVRSTGLYNIASLQEADKNVGRRKLDDDSAVKSLKKHKCDNSSDSNINYNDSIIKRPKFKRFFPIVDKLEKIVHDRKDINKDDMKDLHLNSDDTVFSSPKEVKRHKTYSIGDDDFVFYEKCDYGTIDRNVDQNFKFADPETEDYKGQVLENTKDGFVFPYPKKGDAQVPSPSEMERFRWTFDSAASMVFHTKTGLPLTSSPAPLRRGNNCFDFDDSINGISGIKSALFHPIAPAPAAASPASPAPKLTPSRQQRNKLNLGSSTSLLGSFEESALQGRLEAVATVHGFTAELGASGAFCPPHKRLPVTVFFYAPGGTNAPYMGHINLGPHGYRVSRSGTIQVSLFNPHGTLVKMFVVLYDLTRMPPLARTFLRQRTLYMPAGAEPPSPHHMHKWLRYLIHLRFMTSKSGKLYLHTDIRLIVSRKADMDTATAHSTLFKPMPTKDEAKSEQKQEIETNSRAPNRVFGGSSEYDSERPEITGFDNSNQELTSDITEKGLHEDKNGLHREKNGYTRENGCGDQKSGFDGKLVSKSDLNGFRKEIGYDNLEGVSYELRSFTYAPENPRYSPR